MSPPELTSPDRPGAAAIDPSLYVPAPGRRAAGGRLLWTLADQGLSSIQNAGLSIVLARSVDAHQFGAFSLVFTVYGLLVALSGALAGQVLVIRFAAARGEVRHRATNAATGTSVLIGVIAALGLLTAGFLQTGNVRSALLVTAVVFPGLLLQDAWRTVFISRGTPAQAFANDAIWLALQVVGIGALIALHVTAIWCYLLAWGLAACLAAAVGIRQSGSLPRPLSGPSFVRTHAGVAVPSLASALTAIGASQISLLLIAGYGGLLDIAAFRGAQTLLGPLNVVGFATTAFAVPELVRRRPSRRQLHLAAIAISAGLVIVDLAWGTVLLLLPDQAGHALLGQSWLPTRHALLGMVVFNCAIGFTVGPSVVIDALNRPAYSTWVSLFVSPLTVVLALVGLHLDGARGAAFGFALAAGCGIVPAWLLAFRASGLGRKPSPGDPLPPQPAHAD